MRRPNALSTVGLSFENAVENEAIRLGARICRAASVV